MEQDTATVIEQIELGSEIPDFSLFGMFGQADFIVQTVMITLLLASVWCWAIIYDKIKKLRAVSEKADKFEGEFWSGNSLEDLYARTKQDPDHILPLLFVQGLNITLCIARYI